jgi:hypothetical protein
MDHMFSKLDILYNGMPRKPNIKCKVCGKPTYKRPFEIESYGKNLYCSRKCMYEDRKKMAICPVCHREFQKINSKQTYCSKSCAGIRNRAGKKKGDKKRKSSNSTKLEKLRKKFHLKKCMVVGCEYNKTFDLHRFDEGRNGGKYVEGNMFAICPNHHAEYHRGLIIFKKVSDSELLIVETS